jgi:hypothetical protein
MHLYSGSPGCTVWAQSRQTNRPSLWAIIGLKSMPATQCGQRMVKVMSVSNRCSLQTSKKHWHARFQTPMPGDPNENQRIVGSHNGIEPETQTKFGQECRQAGRSDNPQKRPA